MEHDESNRKRKKEKNLLGDQRPLFRMERRLRKNDIGNGLYGVIGAERLKDGNSRLQSGFDVLVEGRRLGCLVEGLREVGRRRSKVGRHPWNGDTK
jgi:hypothetical protein